MNTVVRPLSDGEPEENTVTTQTAWEMALRTSIQVPVGAGASQQVFVRRLTRWQADRHREQLADLYVAAYTTHRGNDFENRAHFLARLARDVRRPDFDLVMAQGVSSLGYGYGFRISRDGAWWRGFVGTLPGILGEFTACGQVFALAEILVLPSHRRAHVATRIVKALLGNSDAVVATALVPRDNRVAHAAFHALGWAAAGHLKHADGGALLDVLVRPVM